MKRLTILTALAFFLATLLGGGAPFGRVLMSLGLPGMAAVFFEDPAWRGAAAFRAGDFQAAAAAFDEVSAIYNLGNAEAYAGRYAAALEAFDLAGMRGDLAAQANFDVVAAYYAGLGIDAEALALFEKRKQGAQAESFIARGNARAAGSGTDVTNASTMLGIAELETEGRLGVRRVFDDKFMVADDRWLAQLEDVPGAFLAARIAHERKRRAKLGLTPPEPEDPR